MKDKIYCFVGVVGSGKNYQAKLVSEELGTKVFDFSDGVRNYAWKFLGWEPENDLQYRIFKNSKLMGVDLTGRGFLENVAETMKNLHGNYFWARYTFYQARGFYEETGITPVFNSVRFPIEAVYCLDLGNILKKEVEFIFTDYHSVEYDNNVNHISEKFAQYILKKYNPSHYTDITDIVKNLVYDKQFIELFS